MNGRFLSQVQIGWMMFWSGEEVEEGGILEKTEAGRWYRKISCVALSHSFNDVHNILRLYQREPRGEGFDDRGCVTYLG